MTDLFSRFNKHASRRYNSFRHRHIDKFIFIHINKTAGSSIEKALKLNIEHKTALEKIENIGLDNWKKRYSFAVVRNPWDKVVSHYHYRVLTNQTGLSENTIDFKLWVKESYGNKNPQYYDKPKMFMPQSNWVTDSNNELLVNYICRFENLHDDFRHICQMIDKEILLPHIKTSNRGNYRNYYDQETKKIIELWFSTDIDRFDYSF